MAQKVAFFAPMMVWMRIERVPIGSTGILTTCVAVLFLLCLMPVRATNTHPHCRPNVTAR
jgi:hypothetical protein